MNDPRNAQLAKKVLGKLKDLTNKSKKINSLIYKLQTAYGINAGIFGGACRDWYLDKEPKDIDIIVQCKELNTTILDDLILGADTIQKNKFDGFKIFYDEISFDIWKLHETRQFKELNLAPSFENLMKTVPLSTDQIVVTLKGDVYEGGFWKTLDTQTIDLVYYNQKGWQPYVAEKALKCANKYGLKLSERVRDFIKKQNIISNFDSFNDKKETMPYIKNTLVVNKLDFSKISNVNDKHSSGNKNIGIVTNKIENYFCSEPEFIGEYHQKPELKIKDPIYLLEDSKFDRKAFLETYFQLKKNNKPNQLEFIGFNCGKEKSKSVAKVYCNNNLIGYCKLNKPEISIIKQRENKDNIKFELNKDFTLHLK